MGWNSTFDLNLIKLRSFQNDAGLCPQVRGMKISHRVAIMMAV